MQIIKLGQYWQSNNIEKEPIEWVALREEQDRIYVISKYCLDYVPYCNNRKTRVWRDSSVRKWLNEVFVNEAFSSEEQECILCSDIRTQAGGWFGPEWGLDHGIGAVQDKIFLPSIAEAILFFDSKDWHDWDAEQRRIARPTQYAFLKGCGIERLQHGAFKRVPDWIYDTYKQSFDPHASYWFLIDKERKYASDGTVMDADTKSSRWACGWYLRSGGGYLIKVESNGQIHDNSHPEIKNFHGEAIRPAMWIRKMDFVCK